MRPGPDLSAFQPADGAILPAAEPVPEPAASKVSAGKPREGTRAAGSVLRSVLGWGMVVFGALLLLLSLPGVLKFKLFSVILAAITIVFVALGVMLKSRPAEVISGANGQVPGFRHWRTVRIAALLILGLFLIWYAKARQWGEWPEEDERERLAAPVWTYRFDDFSAGITRASLEQQLRAKGFHVRCYGDLQAGERVAADDRELCWTIARSMGDIPSRRITFWFGDDGLRQIRMDFSKAEWPRVQTWFAQQGTPLPRHFGVDQMGSRIYGRKGATGLVLLSGPGMFDWFMVLWQSRELVQQACSTSSRSHDGNHEALCVNWPAGQASGEFAGK